MADVKTHLKRLNLSSATCLKENSAEFVNRTSREYALYVLDRRAIPQFTDGLKSVQRIALWLMRNRSGKIKTLSLSGQMALEELYVHGDKSSNDAISLLAAPYCNNECLLAGHGTFGTKKNPGKDGIAAARYTYVERSKFAQDVLYPDLEIVPMVENHDGSNLMPGTFFPLLPLVLLNGVKGIAVGWATNILPRSAKDLAKAVQEVLETGKVQNRVMPSYTRYDVVVSESEPGRFIIAGRLVIKNTSTVIVTEIPPGITMESFRSKLIKLEEEGKITGWTDRSSRKIHVEIKMRRTDLEQHTEESLVELLKLRVIETENIVVIHGEDVKYYRTAEELIEDWVVWRLGLYLTRYEYLLRREEERAIYWLTVLACHEGTKTKGAVPTVVSKLDGKQALKDHVTAIIKSKKIPLIDENIERVTQIPVYRWTVEGYNEAVDRLNQCEANMDSYEALIKSKARRKTVFKKEVEALS